MEGVLEDRLAVGILASRHRHGGVVADVEPLRPVGHRLGHRPQVDMVGSYAGSNCQEHEEEPQS